MQKNNRNLKLRTPSPELQTPERHANAEKQGKKQCRNHQSKATCVAKKRKRRKQNRKGKQKRTVAMRQQLLHHTLPWERNSTARLDLPLTTRDDPVDSCCCSRGPYHNRKIKETLDQSSGQKNLERRRCWCRRQRQTYQCRCRCWQQMG